MNITTNTQHTVKQLLGDIILAEILPMDRTSVGGIYIPQSVSTLNTQKNGIPACVLMVGSQFRYGPIRVHLEPVNLPFKDQEDCVDCGRSTNMWMKDKYTPLCVACCDERNRNNFSVKKGDIIFVSKYLGTIIDKTKEDIRIYDGEDVLAILNNNE